MRQVLLRLTPLHWINQLLFFLFLNVIGIAVTVGVFDEKYGALVAAACCPLDVEEKVN